MVAFPLPLLVSSAWGAARPLLSFLLPFSSALGGSGWDASIEVRDAHLVLAFEVAERAATKK